VTVNILVLVRMMLVRGFFFHCSTIRYAQTAYDKCKYFLIFNMYCTSHTLVCGLQYFRYCGGLYKHYFQADFIHLI
jgi:hypothetical protein